MKRKCQWCGKSFTPPSTKRGNAMKYCSKECRTQAYHLERVNARERYNNRNPRIKAQVMLCYWCAKPFISTHNRKYCSITCKKEARREQKLRYQQRYRIKIGTSDKQRYFENLGTSNLREHRKPRFEDELRLVKHEKRRLHI